MIKALKVIGAIVAGVASLAAGQALAAGLDPAAPTLGGAQPAASACTSDTLQVGYTTAYSLAVGAGGGYAVVNVSLTDTAAAPNLAACAGQTYRVTLLDATGNPLGEVSGVVPVDASGFAPATGFASPVDASAVSGVSVVLGG